MYIFSNSSHLEWRADLLDTILKGTHPRTIPARFGLIWFRGFRGKDLNVNQGWCVLSRNVNKDYKSEVRNTAFNLFSKSTISANLNVISTIIK
jgi:hypothetical protein